MKKSFTLIILAVLITSMLTSIVSAMTGNIALLAVYEEDGEFKGSPADLQLTVKPGTGRVFLETIPLSKVDTQISTRFAKEMACSFTGINCNRFDFFYTIRSEAGIIGGPSAGAAISALTISMLEGYNVPSNVAVTGTINSGEVIGPVGSLIKKIDAAKDIGLTKVIVPGTPSSDSKDNITGVILYGESQGIEVVPVNMLSEVLHELTGEEFLEDEREISVPLDYQETMQQLANDLCERSDELIANIPHIDNELNPEWATEKENAINNTKKGKDAYENSNYYSASSYCFGSNIMSNQLTYNMKDLDNKTRAIVASELLTDIKEFDSITEAREKKTITDLQTYMIVKERILESKEYLLKSQNESNVLGYVEERLNSAKIWSSFFGTGGEEYQLDNETLRLTCSEILGGVEERFQYLNLFFPGLLTDIRNNLLVANQYYEENDYSMCIYLAKRTKAEADIMVSLLSVTDDATNDILTQKLNAARKSINKQVDKGIFPIVAYSYYEYANSLQENNKYAAAMYAEYALELSDIDIYFEKTSKFNIEKIIIVLRAFGPTLIFIWGILIGLMLAYVFVREKKGDRVFEHKDKKSKKKKVKPVNKKNKPIKNKPVAKKNRLSDIKTGISLK